jgi:5-methylcytosine-specific restriction enzyme B
MALHPKLAEELVEMYRDLRAKGEFLSREKLDHYYSLFRSQFGPERLGDLDGRTLLYTIHALRSSHRNSVVYWLEFKNDDEFPTREFGGIGGGSAMKYGIYQRQEDGAWVTGNPHSPVELTEDEAVEVARKHRDQLLRGV